MNIAIITINKNGENLAKKLEVDFSDVKIFNCRMSHKGALKNLVKNIFNEYDGLIFIAALGIVVRVIAPLIKSKLSDPAVVAVDTAGRFAISALSGHEGGANNLAIKISNILGAEPIVTTASEGKKNIIIGVGCQRGIKKQEIIKAIKFALAKTKQSFDKARYISTIDLKQKEAGLKEACWELGIPLRIISYDLVKNFNGEYERSKFVKEKIGLEGVCEPCALLAARKPKIILSKQKIGKVTVAVARET